MRGIGKVGGALKRGGFAGPPKCFRSAANKGVAWKRLRCALRRRSTASSASVASRSRSSHVPPRVLLHRNSSRLLKGRSPLGNAAGRSLAKCSPPYCPWPTGSLPVDIPVNKWLRHWCQLDSLSVQKRFTRNPQSRVIYGKAAAENSQWWEIQQAMYAP